MLQQYIQKGVSLQQYKSDTIDTIENGQEHEKYEFYGLNHRRSERLRKKIVLSKEQLDLLENIPNEITLLIITEGWCGDAAQIIPIIEKMVENTPKLDAKVVYRDQSLDLMNAYLTNGGQSIPIVIGVNNRTEEEIFHWGPRPKFGMDLLQRMKSGEIPKDQFYIDLQKAYNKDKGKSIFSELMASILA